MADLIQFSSALARPSFLDWRLGTMSALNFEVFTQISLFPNIISVTSFGTSYIQFLAIVMQFRLPCVEGKLCKKVKIILEWLSGKFPYAAYFFKNAFQKKNLKSFYECNMSSCQSQIYTWVKSKKCYFLKYVKDSYLSHFSSSEKNILTIPIIRKTL